ncbi:response regulator of the LytR/AlgR family [Caulobacter sp. AP07]|uniref:LytR/AlgR family response regulator transcription factor n=1 Tax=Caulobacter sp. AP07 TaxID=1144304 RepID=UPI000271FC20|nr:LytTR family DNA-binding domain-containing protein [Caulobacter sp. AP07]EJL35582.1 response regulator of the LytR/AlgR family [Caulobacter sp. AP07]
MSTPVLTVLLADDEPLALRRLQRLVSEVEDVRIVATATDGDQALARARETAAEVVIIDIKMPGLDGVSVARALAGPDGPVVIFATAFDRYAIQAFDLAAVDYLLKPFDAPRVAEALGRARAQVRARDAEQRIGELRAIVQDLRAEHPEAEGGGFETELWIDNRGGAQRLLVRDLDWIEAERDYVRLHVGERSYLVRDSIRSLIERLDPACFVRIHRSAVVQRDRVAQLAPRPGGGLTAVLSTGARPPIGRSHAAAVRRLFRRTPNRA